MIYRLARSALFLLPPEKAHALTLGAVRLRGRLVRPPALQGAPIDPAKRVRFLQDGLEHWHKVARRGIDDLQQLRGGGLLLTRLFQFAGESAHLIL